MNSSLQRSIPYVWVVMIVLFLYSGCEYSRHSKRINIDGAEPFVFAVLPFNNQTDHFGAGKIVTELFYTELVAGNNFMLAAPQQVNMLVSDQTATADEILHQYSLQEIRKRLSAGAVVQGTVTEFLYKKGIRERPVVGLDVKIVSLQDGSILWAGSYTREELSFLFYEGSLNSITQRMCRKIVKRLYRSFN